jgi:hypothetical protein
MRVSEDNGCDKRDEKSGVDEACSGASGPTAQFKAVDNWVEDSGEKEGQ